MKNSKTSFGRLSVVLYSTTYIILICLDTRKYWGLKILLILCVKTCIENVKGILTVCQKLMKAESHKPRTSVLGDGNSIFENPCGPNKFSDWVTFTLIGEMCERTTTCRTSYSTSHVQVLLNFWIRVNLEFWKLSFESLEILSTSNKVAAWEWTRKNIATRGLTNSWYN